MKRIFAGIAVFVLVAVSTPGIVIAQQNNSEAQTNNNASTQSTADGLAERQARVDEAKKNQVKISATEERRVAGLCKASQTIIARLQTRVQKTAETRKANYETASNKLVTLVARLQAASVDTTELEAAISNMNERIVAHVSTTLKNYQTVITDLSEMDCASDPSGFKALIIQIRTQRGTLVEQSKGIKNLVTVEIKAILTDIKAQLEAAKTDAEEE